MWPSLFLSLFTTTVFISNAYAHGYIRNATVDGKPYKGIAPWEGDSPSTNNGPIRQVAANGPVKDLKSADIACGLDAQFAGGVADAKPGSALVFEWGNAGSKNVAWPHDVGPIMTYMALCKGSCTKFNGTDAQWFKIDQLGQKKDGTWYQADLMAGKPITLSLPNDLPSGDYLLRHEIISLHLAESLGGAEFYPNCIQIHVTGDGSSTKQPDSTVSFPGAYDAKDPGILVNVFNNPKKLKYIFPGPPLSVFAVTIDMASTEGGQAPSGALQADAMPTPSAKVDDSSSNFGTPTAESPEAVPSDSGEDPCSDGSSSDDSGPSSTATEGPSSPSSASTSSDGDPDAGPTDEPCSSEAPSSDNGGSSGASQTDTPLVTSSPTSAGTQTATEDTGVVTTIVTMTVIVTPLPAAPTSPLSTSMTSGDNSDISTTPSETLSPSDASITSTTGSLSSQSTATPSVTSPSTPAPNVAVDRPPSATTAPFTTLSSSAGASPRPMAMRMHRRRRDASRSRWNTRWRPAGLHPALNRVPRALGIEA